MKCTNGITKKDLEDAIRVLNTVDVLGAYVDHARRTREYLLWVIDSMDD